MRFSCVSFSALCTLPVQIVLLKGLKLNSWGLTHADFAAATSAAMAAIASVDVCEEYCRTMVRVCHGMNSAACGAGVISALLAMMQAHPASEVVQEDACIALSVLLRVDGKMEGRFLGSGGLQQVDPATENVLESGWEALARLAEASDGNADRTVGSGCLELVYAAMKAHPTSLTVQRGACGALRCLVENEGCAGWMRADGRAAVLLEQAMAAHPDHGYLQSDAYRALLWLEAPEVGWCADCMWFVHVVSTVCVHSHHVPVSDCVYV